MRRKLLRIFPALLALCMLVGLIPAASAAGPAFYSIRVEASKGGTVLAPTSVVLGGGQTTVTIAAEEGYVIDYIDIDGAKFLPGSKNISWENRGLATYTFALVMRDHYLIAYFKEGVAEEEIPEPEWENPYKDVAKDAWYYSAVQYVTDKELMDAVGAATFAPDRNTTRGEIVLAIWRAMGMQPAVGKKEFTDVKEGDLLYKAVTWCSDNGIVQGLPDGSFSPDMEVSREQLATFLYRYAEFLGKATSEQTELNFVDAAQVSEYAAQAVGFMSAKGVIQGNELGQFLPQGDASRSAVAAMLMRFAEI